jgi:hypothetical protein
MPAIKTQARKLRQAKREPAKPDATKPDSAKPDEADTTKPSQTPSRKMTPEEAVIELARRGNKTIIPQLEWVLDKEPQLWKDIGDITRLAEQAWIDQIAGSNVLNRQCIRRKVEQMREDLAEATSNALEKALIDRIVCCWLAVHLAELHEAMADVGGLQVSLLQLKRLESANRRFLQATKSLAQVRRLTAGIKIEITHHAPASPREAVGNAVAERMRQENVVTACS